MSKPGTMSDAYNEQEEKGKKEQMAVESAENAAKTFFYWAPASEYQLANWREEEKSGGAIIRPEGSLKWGNHIRATDDPKMIAFIEASGAFKSGIIKKYKTATEAQLQTAKQSMAKGESRKMESSDISSTKMG